MSMTRPFRGLVPPALALTSVLHGQVQQELRVQATGTGMVSTPQRTLSANRVPFNLVGGGAISSADAYGSETSASMTCRSSVNSNVAGVPLSSHASITVIVTASAATYVNIQVSTDRYNTAQATNSLTGSISYGSTTVPIDQSSEITAGYHMQANESLSISAAVAAGTSASQQNAGAQVNVYVAVQRIGIVSIPGLRPVDRGDYTPRSDPSMPGRLFMNTVNDGRILGARTDQQHTLVVVSWSQNITKSIGVILRWELWDPDDPASSRCLDRNGTAGGDNSGTPEAALEWFGDAGTGFVTAPSNVRGGPVDPELGALIGVAETPASGAGGDEPIRFNYSSDGGDNYRLRVTLLRRSDRARLAMVESRMITVWRYRELDVYTMDNPFTKWPTLWVRGFETLVNQTFMHDAFASSDPDCNAYIDFRVTRYRTPYQMVTVRPDTLSSYMDGQAGFTHAAGRYSLLGHGDAPYTGNAELPPHAAVNVKLFYGYLGLLGRLVCSPTEVKEQLRNTSGHEVGHLLLLGDGTDFHVNHTSGAHPGAGRRCMFNQLADRDPGPVVPCDQARTWHICEYHLNKLRDQVTLEALDHDPSRATYDSAPSRGKAVGRDECR